MATAQVRRRDAGLQEKGQSGFQEPDPPPRARTPAARAPPRRLRIAGTALRPASARAPRPAPPPEGSSPGQVRTHQTEGPSAETFGERRSAGDSAVGRAEMQAQKAPDSRSRLVPSNGNTLGPAPAPVPPRPAPPRPGPASVRLRASATRLGPRNRVGPRPR